MAGLAGPSLLDAKAAGNVVLANGTGTSFTQAGTPDVAMCFVYLDLSWPAMQVGPNQPQDLLLHLSQGQDCLLCIPICDIYGS